MLGRKNSRSHAGCIHCVPTVFLMFGKSHLIPSFDSLPGRCHHFYSQSHILASSEKLQFEGVSSRPPSPLSTPSGLQIHRAWDPRWGQDQNQHVTPQQKSVTRVTPAGKKDCRIVL